MNLLPDQSGGHSTHKPIVQMSRQFWIAFWMIGIPLVGLLGGWLIMGFNELSGVKDRITRIEMRQEAGRDANALAQSEAKEAASRLETRLETIDRRQLEASESLSKMRTQIEVLVAVAEKARRAPAPKAAEAAK